MALELTQEQAERFRLLKTGKWHDYPMWTSKPNKKRTGEVIRSE